VNEPHHLASMITEKLRYEGPCTWEALVARISPGNWNGVFAAIDALSREGTIALQPAARFQYLVSLTPRRDPPQPPDVEGSSGKRSIQHRSGMEQTLFDGQEQ
jgi:hypothetical protein